MYQLYAYASRYGSRNNVLLFPRVPGVTAKRYFVDNDPGTLLRVAFLDLSFDLRRNRQKLLAEFIRILDPDTASAPVSG
jgi:hypothetical protein